MQKQFDLDKCELGVIQNIYGITDDLHISIFHLDKYENSDAVTIMTSEAYAGSAVGHGTAWAKDMRISCLLATARILEWDHSLGLQVEC